MTLLMNYFPQNELPSIRSLQILRAYVCLQNITENFKQNHKVTISQERKTSDYFFFFGKWMGKNDTTMRRHV